MNTVIAEPSVNQNTILRVYERLTIEGFLERRHGEGTFVADTIPSGQMNAQRQVLHQQIAQVAELANTLGIDVEEVLTGLDLLVQKGSVLVLHGTNGAGKTTLIKCA